MVEHPKEPKFVDIGAFIDKKMTFEIRTAEAPDELKSRLRREEAEAEHKLSNEANEDAHKRRLSLIIHIFVMVVVTAAFGASVYVIVFKEPASGLPDKAMGVIIAIVTGAVGYMTGRNTK